jgi:hypothetical protein
VIKNNRVVYNTNSEYKLNIILDGGEIKFVLETILSCEYEKSYLYYINYGYNVFSRD